MLPTSETDVVLEHALRNEENLAVAAAVGVAYPLLCGRVIAGVVDAVAKELSTRLGSNWMVTDRCTPDQLATRYNECLVAKFTGHPTRFRVVLAADESDYPKRPYIAVRADPPAKPELLERVKKLIDQACRPGKSSPYSVWYRYAEKPHAVWGSPEGLVALYRKTESVAYVLDHLEKIAKAVEQALSTPASEGVS